MANQEERPADTAPSQELNPGTFSYVKYDQVSVTKQESLKALFEEIERFVKKNLKPGRCQSLVMTYLEIAYMWTGKAIRDEQIERDRTTAHAPERSQA